MAHQIIVGSEGMGKWGKPFINFMLKALGYEKIVYSNEAGCSFILSSLFLGMEPSWNRQKKKYLYWSGESTTPQTNCNASKELFVITTLEKEGSNCMYVPYFLYHPQLPKLYNQRKFDTKHRKFLVAYCSRNRKTYREEFFNMLVERKGRDTCHSLGRCCGKYPETRRPVPGDWHDTRLVEEYKKYNFVFAMENGNRKGYVTEKIVNAFCSGAIPIYFGCQEVKLFFNPKAFIHVNDFESFEKCVDHICNMTDEDIKAMRSEEIINTESEIANLMNTKYTENPTLSRYLSMFSDFINN